MDKTKVPDVYQKFTRKQDAANLELLVYALIRHKINLGLLILDWNKKIIKKKRAYLHFDFHLSPEKSVNYVISPFKIHSHQFYPLIKFQKVEKKYVKGRNKNEKGIATEKIREIYYAAHKDAHIYSWYSVILEKYYEDILVTKTYKDSIIAYRKLNHKSNIDFAFEVFEYIKYNNPCSVITIDIRSFFDELNHKNLKTSWRKIMQVDLLPEDHYKIFRSLTQFAYVDKNKLYDIFGIKKGNNLKTICSNDDFHKKVKTKGNSLVEVHTLKKGIPQETPMSAILSNIYMMNFDKNTFAYAKRHTAFYRRYSDDIIIVCNPNNQKQMMNYLKRTLKKIGLNINDKKTHVVLFKKDFKGKLIGYSQLGKLVNLQYLGFDFDGERYLIRSSSLSRYYKRMKKTVKSAYKKTLKNSKNKNIYKHKLFDRFTHLGKRNFISYAKLSSLKMKSTKINHQIKNHMNKLTKIISKGEKKIKAKKQSI